jgi:hypothetical protein
LAQRRALRSQWYESGRSRKTRPPPTREPML